MASFRKTMKAAKKRAKASRSHWITDYGGIALERVLRDKRDVRREKAMKRADRKLSGDPYSSLRSVFGVQNPRHAGPSATKGIWTVRTWHGDTGQFSTRKAAQQYCTQRRQADRQAGNKVDAHVVRLNPVHSVGPSAIPSRWIPVSITRQGKQIQIHTRGR